MIFKNTNNDIEKCKADDTNNDKNANSNGDCNGNCNSDDVDDW